MTKAYSIISVAWTYFAFKRESTMQDLTPSGLLRKTTKYYNERPESLLGIIPKPINDWSLRSLQVKLIKTGGRIVRHARQIIFQLSEVAVSRDLFTAILERITRLCLSPS